MVRIRWTIDWFIYVWVLVCELKLKVAYGSSDRSSRFEKVYYSETGITKGSGEKVSEGAVDIVICMGVGWESDG